MKDITTFGNFFAFCLLILSFACQKDDAGIGSHIEDTGTHINSSRDISSSTYKYVTPDEIPDVIEAYSNYSGKISPKQFRESPNASLIMETTSIDGVKSYSMRLLEKENNPYVLYNLVVKQAPGETPSRPFIVKYETDTPIDEITPESYKNTQWSISTYWANNMELWGEIPKDGNRGAFARTEGIGETGPPCGGSSSSGGGGGGSGSSDSWWTISDYNFGNSNYGSGGGSSGGGGGSGNSTQLICNVRIRVSQYHCNGPNGGTPHPAGPNSGEPGDNKCGDSSTGYGGSGDNIIVELYCTEISMAVEDAPWVREEETHTLDFCEMAEIRDLLQSKASDLDTSQLALLTELENSIENVDLGACVDKASQQERKTLVMKRNEGEEDGPANPEDSDVPDEEVIKDDCPDIDGIGLNSISAEVLEVMNSLLHLEENYEGISKEQTNWILNTKNQSKVAEIHSFLGNNNNSREAKIEALMRIDMYRANDNGWDYSKTGTFLNRSALKYKAAYTPAWGEQMYLLESGQVLYQSATPRVINRKVQGSIAATELPVDGYNYIYSYETNKWYEYKLPNPDYTHTDLGFLIDAFWEGAKFVGRYAIPLEDAIVLIDGKDFDGVEQNRALTAGMIIVGFIPGSKVMKPITKVVKGTLAWKTFANVGKKTVNLSFKVVNGAVDFGSRNKLATIIKTSSLEEAHHIIPWNKLGDDVVQEAAYAGFHMNSTVNGKALQKYTALTGEGLHGNHPQYDIYVQGLLNGFKAKNPGFTPEIAKDYLEKELIPELVNLIEAAKNSGLNLNEYFRLLN